MAKRNAPPRAAALVESLRGLGYSLATALADIFDNSIAAGAKTVELVFEWAGVESWIRIVDDGKGMSAEEIDSAMRLGDRNPLETRTSDDLGRFGLGLKTASFSQARRLTVASRARGHDVECLRWDLDILAASAGDEWFLLEGPEAGSEALLTDLDQRASGTTVLLEKLDRIVTPGFSATDFLDLIDGVEQHLAMTFHRYLDGGDARLRIIINGASIAPWDPFMMGHPSKPWVKPQVRLPWTSPVFVECHVLPHKDKLSPREQEIAAGPQGWSGSQGFYVYRNERLIVSGSWLGLGAGRQWTKDEAYRLARIRLDITNEADAAWKLDIRKSIARPPVELRRMLTRLAEETRDRARQVFAHRGGIVTASRRGDPVEPLWEFSKTSKGARYRISREHDAVRTLLDRAPKLRSEIEALLRLVEETVPVQRIWLDTSEDRETPLTGFVGEPSAEVMPVLATIYRSLLRKTGMSPEAARRRLSSLEPFDKYPELVAALPDALVIDGEVE